MRVAIFRESSARDLPLPAYATDGAAGLDLRAAVLSDLTLAPGQRALIPTGIRLALPPGSEAQIRPRSGLALRCGLGLLNSPGTIDCDYRGEISVVMINWGQLSVTIERGDRIAQLVVAPVLRVEWEDAGDLPLPETDRGTAGFGHTGGHNQLRTAEEG